MLAALLLAASSGPALAGDVLVPDFTPSTTSDFQLAEDLTQAVLSALRDKGIVVVDPAEIRTQAQDAADGCAEEPSCPGNLWPWFDARYAVVGAATYASGSIEARVQLFERTGQEPARTIEDRLPGDDLALFAGTVAEAVVDLMPAGGDLVVPVRERYDSPRPAPPADEPEDEPLGDLDEPAISAREAAPLDTRAADQERQDMGGIPWTAYQRYKDSGLSRDAWLEKAKVRAGSIIAEIHAGAVLGDVDRRYDTRVAVERQASGDLETLDVYSYETFVKGTAFMVGGAVGYIPTYWFEVSLFGGVQFGHKQLSTGWEQQQSGDVYDSDVEIYDPAAATLAVLEPRSRIYLAAAGAVKPYVLLAFDLRFYDGYTTPDLAEIDYPDRPGGTALGPTLGAGLAFDTPGRGTGFVEIPWTYLFVPATPFTEGGSELSELPDQYGPLRQYVAFRAGLGTRF